MRKTLILAAVALCLALVVAGCGAREDDTLSRSEAAVADHMVAQATLAAHYIAAATSAGMSANEINASLARIADQTLIAEFWISDETGRVVFTSAPGVEFTFPTDPNAGTQAAPFAQLLAGSKQVVIQGVEPRELDQKPFMYVGVAGVDRPRIVQVGIPGSALGD